VIQLNTGMFPHGNVAGKKILIRNEKWLEKSTL